MAPRARRRSRIRSTSRASRRRLAGARLVLRFARAPPVCLARAATSACAPKTLKLPDGHVRHRSTTRRRWSARRCGIAPRVQSLTLNRPVGQSGQDEAARPDAGGFRAPDAIRLEAVAPFGAPFFIVAGRRDRRRCCCRATSACSRDAAPQAMIDALAGLSVSPADLGAWLAGCPAPAVRRGRGAGVTDRTGRRSTGEAARTAWVRRTDRWRLVRAMATDFSVEFADHIGTQPRRVRIRRADASAVAPRSTRGMAVSQVETNVELRRRRSRVKVPADAAPITLDELRASGPLRDAVSAKHALTCPHSSTRLTCAPTPRSISICVSSAVAARRLSRAAHGLPDDRAARHVVTSSRGAERSTLDGRRDVDAARPDEPGVEGGGRACGAPRASAGLPSGARIVDRKRIPSQAGLGGGSSDAAATPRRPESRVAARAVARAPDGASPRRLAPTSRSFSSAARRSALGAATRSTRSMDLPLATHRRGVGRVRRVDGGGVRAGTRPERPADGP